MRTTIQVFDSRKSGCSKWRTYSYLAFVSSGSFSAQLSSCKLVHFGSPLSNASGDAGAYFELAIARSLAIYLTERSIACIA